MKPREKVVSAQDVESSLYYLHLETAVDSAIRVSVQSMGLSKDSNDGDPASHGLFRPPLVTRDSDDQPASPTDTLPEAPKPNVQSQRIPRKPIGRNSPPKESPQNLLRRPFGPRPLNNAPLWAKENDDPPMNEVPPRLPLRRNTNHAGPPIGIDHGGAPALPTRVDTGEWFGSRMFRDAAPPPLPLRRSTDMSDAPLALETKERRDSSSASSEASFVNQKDFQITVIRRNPVTGGQWNVGTLTKDSTLVGPKGTSVELAISSGSYNKFVDDDSEDDTVNEPGFKYTSFRRDLNLRRRKPNRRDSRQTSFPQSPEPNEASRRISPLRHSYDAGNSSPFSFTSPWHGACEFATGIAGRSMKCRHIYPPPSSDVAFEPKLALLNSTAISELRLNLPVLNRRRDRIKHRPALSANPLRTSFFSSSSSRLGAGNHNGPPQPESSDHAKSRLRSHSGFSAASRLRHRLSRSIDATSREEEDELPDAWDDAVADDPMDLSLGRERAGGGFRGSKAKLGKLIVEGDGMLMLDLVVMANMGLWWAVASR